MAIRRSRWHSSMAQISAIGCARAATRPDFFASMIAFMPELALQSAMLRPKKKPKPSLVSPFESNPANLLANDIDCPVRQNAGEHGEMIINGRSICKQAVERDERREGGENGEEDEAAALTRLANSLARLE